MKVYDLNGDLIPEDDYEDDDSPYSFDSDFGDYIALCYDDTDEWSALSPAKKEQEFQNWLKEYRFEGWDDPARVKKIHVSFAI